MNLEMFLLVLLVISSMTGLVTEGMKVLLTEWGRKYRPNTLAGVVSIILSMLTCVAYTILCDIPVDAKLIVYFIALVIMSWLSAMLGYDKVVQTITQIKTRKE